MNLEELIEKWRKKVPPFDDEPELASSFSVIAREITSSLISEFLRDLEALKTVLEGEKQL